MHVVALTYVAHLDCAMYHLSCFCILDCQCRVRRVTCTAVLRGYVSLAPACAYNVSHPNAPLDKTPITMARAWLVSAHWNVCPNGSGRFRVALVRIALHGGACPHKVSVQKMKTAVKPLAVRSPRARTNGQLCASTLHAAASVEVYRRLLHMFLRHAMPQKQQNATERPLHPGCSRF